MPKLRLGGRVKGARQRSRSDAEGALDAVAQAQTMRSNFAAKPARVLDLYDRVWDGKPLAAKDYVISADE